MKALLAALTLMSASAHALDIKGVRVDAPIDCEAIASLMLNRNECEAGKAALVTVAAPFLSGRAALQVTQNADRVVTSVVVMQFDFQEALDALTLKFGKPEITRSTVQNRMGASFDQVVATWTAGQATLTLSRHGSSIAKPILQLVGSTYGTDAIRERLKKAASGASNI